MHAHMQTFHLGFLEKDKGMLRSLQHPHTQRRKVAGRPFPHTREGLNVGGFQWVPVNRTSLGDLRTCGLNGTVKKEGWAGMGDQ